MNAYDCARSYVTFVTLGRRNNTRLQVESVRRLSDLEAGTSTEYCFFASCKLEYAFAETDLFQEENYDFCGIFSEAEYAIFRTHATRTEGFRDDGLWRTRFEDVRFSLVEADAHPLASAAKIVSASLDDVPLTGEVELESVSRTATIQFRIKTMNAKDIEMVHQADTGPIPFPNFTSEVELDVLRFSPAYVAYNAPHFADFVVQQPVDVGESVQMTH